MTRRKALKDVGGVIGAAAGTGFSATANRSFPAPAQAPELCFKTAIELRDMIRQRQVSVAEVVESFLAQIDRVNPKVNAICTLHADRAMTQARKMDENFGESERSKLLAGLPIAIKDLAMTKGMRTTFGSPIYKDFVPEVDDLFVERLKFAGAIVIGKSNTPEFGAGSHTFNPVFGVTRNPYDLTKSAGGSSGGGAAAVASGMLPFADGSDLGGSVRNPPNFNNIVGLRPSPGRIPHYPEHQPWNSLPVIGPMARHVGDAVLLLTAMAGFDPRSPISISESPKKFLEPLKKDFKGTRIGWSRDLGQFPVQKEVVSVLEKSLRAFEDLGCHVEEAHPDFTGAAEIFHILRAQSFASGLKDDLRKNRSLMKDTVIWNIEAGLNLSGLDISQAQAQRGELFHRVRLFFEKYDFLLLPVSQVVPFPVELEWPREINGVKMESYIDWMKSCSFITLTEHPAASVPTGFTASGLPVGLQIVGRFREEFELLQFAYAFEQATKFGEMRPKIA